MFRFAVKTKIHCHEIQQIDFFLSGLQNKNYIWLFEDFNWLFFFSVVWQPILQEIDFVENIHS